MLLPGVVPCTGTLKWHTSPVVVRSVVAKLNREWMDERHRFFYLFVCFYHIISFKKSPVEFGCSEQTVGTGSSSSRASFRIAFRAAAAQP